MGEDFSNTIIKVKAGKKERGKQSQLQSEVGEPLNVGDHSFYHSTH
jgi:hypothetical protein